MARLRATIMGAVLLVLVLVAWPGTASAADAADANLIFIHHSVGGNWLGAGLRAELNANDYFVADTNYGWTGGSGYDYGSHTDTVDWPTWFTDSVMDRVYADLVDDTGNTLDPAAGENTIVMFKSCYPNSNVGDAITDEKAVYNSLLPYFQAHPDKMFVLITPPPMQSIETPLLTRELCNWLTDRDAGWLKDLTTGNVFVFDFYNVLTNPNAHHRLVSGVESHVVVPGANTLYYPDGGDDHPSEAGSDKATAEFVPLLDAWYEEFLAAAGSAPRRYQQTDSHITYLGSWSTHWSSLASGGNLYYASAKGAAAVVKFTGTSVEVLTKKGPNYGLVQFCLDGTWDTTPVDLYSGTALYQQSVFSRGLLDDEEHTLLVKCLGEKNAASTGYYVGVDALRITGTIAQADTPTVSEQTNSHLAYAGAWTPGWSASASGGGFVFADSAGSAVCVTFNGTYFAWLAKTSPVYGRAWVKIDTGAPVLVDLYSSTVKYKQRVYDTGLIDYGAHTVTIYWLGEKNPSASGTNVSIDAFETMGALTTAPAPERIGYLYQQNDARITYVGSWSTNWSTGASGGSQYYAGAKGSGAIVHFTGTEVQVLAKRAPNYGMVSFCLDGVWTTDPVDLYSSTLLQQQSVFSRDGLEDREHVLMIRCAGEKNAASTGYYVGLDALRITGALTQAARPVRLEQNDGRFSYSGSWAGSWTAKASGGSFRVTNSSGSAVCVTFNGTYFAWLAKTSPVYGRAWVRVDSGAPVPVDLYSSTAKYRQRVYETSLLDDGAHTVTIYWAGQKRIAAWGTNVSVDAFDILGGVTTAPAPEALH